MRQWWVECAGRRARRWGACVACEEADASGKEERGSRRSQLMGSL